MVRFVLLAALLVLVGCAVRNQPGGQMVAPAARPDAGGSGDGGGGGMG